MLDVVVVVLGFATETMVTDMLVFANKTVLSVAVRWVELLITQFEEIPVKLQLLLWRLISGGNS